MVGSTFAERKQLEKEKVLREQVKRPAATAKKKQGSQAKAQTVQGSKFKKSYRSTKSVAHRPAVVDMLHNGQSGRGVSDPALLNFLEKVIGSEKSKTSTARSAKRFASNAQAAKA
jgi:hypothetical protein